MFKIIPIVPTLFALRYKFLLILFPTLLLLISLSSQKTDAGSGQWKQQKIATMYEEYRREFPEVPRITASELQQLRQQKDIILVDVRTLEEQAVSIIPGAISQSEFEQNLDKYKDYPIVVYCTIGYRSGKYAQKLYQQGLNIFNLEGSILAWSHIGGELLNSLGKTQKIHVFGKKWELTADDYEPVW